MSNSSGRITGVAMILAGIALGLWVVFGAPHDWHGGMRFLRYALALGCFGAIIGGVKLVFPDTQDGSPSDTQDGADGSRV